MFQQARTAQLNDYFRPLSERGGSRVFFCRIAGYGETVAAFLRRYYEAARRSGVIIDGRIPNPTPDNLSYFNEMMGSGFQMDRDFLSQRLKKWLPRMTDGQRDAVVTAMYATLDDMRRAGKNDNMLRNAYMKYMCWLYYKFERIVNVLGGETLPKILYAGDVSHYELQLLTVLSRAGADIVLLECGGDGKLTMAATNNEVALERRMPAQIQEAGALLINAKLFANMLGVLGGETVAIQGEDGRQAEITSGACRYTIALMDVLPPAKGCVAA